MKTLKRILKICGVAIAGLLLLIILAALFTQTGYFRERLRVLVASAISTNLNGSVHLGEIDGNFLTGFTIDSVAVVTSDETFLTTRKITIHYDLLPALEKQVSIGYLIIEQPVIHFRKNREGYWNVTHLFRSNDDTATYGPSAWTIHIDDLQIKNGTVALVDSAALSDTSHWNMPDSFVEYHQFSVNDLNVQLKARIKANSLTASIVHANFYSPQSRFELTHLRGDFEANTRGTSAHNVIIQTGHSYVEVDALMKGLDIFHGIQLEDMQSDSTTVTLKAKNIDMGELRSFIPQLSFLDGSAFIDLDAAGEFGNLTVNHLNINTFETSLNLVGTIRNLHKPKDLTLAVYIGDSKVRPSDASHLLAGLKIPTFDSLGAVSLSCEYTGRPLNFKTRTVVRGSFGEISVNGGMNLEHDPPSYTGSFTTTKLDLAPILANPQFQTALTTTGTITGSGFTIENVTGNMQLTVDSSRLKYSSINPSLVTISAVPHQLDGTLELNSQEMKATVHGHGDFTNRDIPSFYGDVSLKSFDLAKILNDAQYKSNLTLDANISGTGGNIDDLSTDLTLLLHPSMFQDRELTQENIHLALDQHDADHKLLRMQSSLADVDFIGKFDLDLMVAAIFHQATNLIDRISEHASPPESIIVKKEPKLVVRRHTEAERRLQFDYSIKVKNLEPLSSILDGSPFDAKADLSGSVAGSTDQLSVSCNGTLDEFYIGSVDGGVLFRDSHVDVTLESLNDINTLEQLRARADIQIGSGVLTTTEVNDLRLKVTYNNLVGTFVSDGTIDSAYHISAGGKTSVQPNTYVIDFDSLIFSSGQYAWHNDQDVQLRLNYDGIRILHADMRRNGESISVTGSLHPTGDIDMTAAVKKFDLGELGILLRNDELSRPAQGFSGSADANLHLSGSIADPIIEFSATGDNTSFRQTRIGTVLADIHYKNRVAGIYFTVKGTPSDSVPRLIVRGSLPINAALTGVEDRFPDQEQKIEIISEGFDVSAVDPLLPDFDNLSGMLYSKVTMRGTPRNPKYEGTVSLNNVQFIFGPNNIAYTVSGELEPSNEKLVLKNFTIKNVPYKGLSGEASVNGSIALKEFQITDFNLTVLGDLLLMTEATRKTIPSMYGTLFTEIDPEGLRVTGTLRQPFLSGKLYVREANLIFPPTKVSERVNSNLTLNYVVIDDTSKRKPSDRPASKYYATRDTHATSEPQLQTRESPLLDRLRYNVNVETRGTTGVKMIFSPATNEELYAELEGSVTAVNNTGTPRIFGNISVAPRSYYNFFKRFDATGDLKFVGQWDNPELDIKATYEGYRRDPSHDSIEQRVIVNVNITGTRYEPKLEMGMKIQRGPGEEPVDWATQAKGGDVQSDAISFIITGKFRDDLTSREKENVLTNFGSATGSSVASNLLSGVLTDFLRQEFPWIRSAEVSYQSGGPSVNLTATPGIGYLRVGRIQDIGSANVSYQLNLGDVFESPSVRNLFIEIQRKVEGENPNEKKLTNEARLYYRFSF